MSVTQSPIPSAGTSDLAANRTSVIETDSLSKVYPGGTRAVDRLSLSILEGEIFGLLGPNGAGKTTTVGLLTTRILPSEGTAAVGGIDVVAHPARAKQGIGVVPQTNTLDRSLSVFENLYFHCRYFGMGAAPSKARAAELLTQFRLSDHQDAPVAALSGGMAQRLMVARAIAHTPHILFLDEPTAGLDPQSRLALWEILRDLHATGQTVLLTTHYMEEADKLCDRVAIMDHGKILALDTPAALKSSLDAESVVRVETSGDTAALAEHLRQLPNATKVEAADGLVHVYLKGVSRALGTVVAAAEQGHFPITDLSAAEPTLESVFISLTGRELRE